MALFRTSNPALNSKTFSGLPAVAGETMTISGTVNKAGILLLCVLATAAWTWNRFYTDPASAGPLVIGGAIGGFVVALVTIFKKEWAPVTSPIYALLEGLVLGGLSAVFEVRYPGIAVQAVALTLGVLIVMLLAYRTGMIRATARFKLGVIAATGGIALFYIASLILGFFGVRLVPAAFSSSPLAIGLSVFVVIIASLNLVLDFDFIESGANAGAPKYMEWYGAFGLMVTLIWLYLEILRLLARVRGRR
jgi:uncharacterized YccA/Bax inhibitor family protein